MTLPVTWDTALDPVRAAMLCEATEYADRTVAQARDCAAALIASARQDAAAAIAAASADGAAQARPVAAAELSRSRRATRSVALRARREIRDELTGRIRDAVSGLRDEPEYAGLLSRLGVMAARAAGPGAVVSEHPDGGVIARAGGVVVNCSLPRLADEAIAALAARIDLICGP